mgnify:CR=1 FL=1
MPYHPGSKAGAARMSAILRALPDMMRAEPEIAFILGEPLRGPGVTAAQALSAVKHVVGALEIIDSRYSGFKFTLADAVADAVGAWRTGGARPALPPHLADLMDRPERVTEVANDQAAVEALIRERARRIGLLEGSAA